MRTPVPVRMPLIGWLRRRIPSTWPLSAGIALVLISVVMELTDAEPRLMMWVGAAAVAWFLMGVPMVTGDADEVMTARARLLIGASGGAVLAVIGLWRVTGRDQPVVLLLFVPSLLLFVTAALAIREAGLAGDARRARQLRARFQGQESERRRWAQELHDQTLQDLAALELWLAGLSRTQDPEKLAAGVQDARGMVHEQIGVLRHLITQMRPLALDTLGLAAAVQDLARHGEAQGDITVTCDVSGLPPGLPDEVQVAVYRIVQEALSNALQHAACEHVQIRTGREGPHLVVKIRDDGTGIPDPEAVDPARSSFGRIGMLERSDSIGARLTWTAPPEGGTLVTLRVPDPSPRP